MSFLSEMTVRRLATISRTARFTTARIPCASFTTTVQLRKTPVVDTAKDTLKTVDRAVSDKLVDGINIATTAKDKVKDAAAHASSGKASGEAAKIRGEAQGKAQELKGEAKGTAAEAKGTVNEKVGEAKGAIKDKVNKL